VVVGSVGARGLLAALLRLTLAGSDGPDRSVAVDRDGRDHAVLSIDSGAGAGTELTLEVDASEDER
jgi:hypothetical protein